MGGNDSTWTVYALGLPKWYAVIPTIFTVMIIVNNVLVLVTLNKVNRKSFQDIFMMGLAAADLITALPLAATSGSFMIGYNVITDEICPVYAVYTTACVATTTWLHSMICIDKCLSIVRSVWHKLFAEKRTTRNFVNIILVTVFVFPLAYFGVLSILNVFQPTSTSRMAGCIFVIDWSFVLCSFIPFGVMPLTTELVTYALIVRQIRKLDARRRKSTIKAYKTVTLTVGVYYLSIVPVSITSAVRAASIDIPIFIEYAATQAVCLNSAVNFWIYLTTLPRFQHHFKTVTSKCLVRSGTIHPL